MSTRRVQSRRRGPSMSAAKTSNRGRMMPSGRPDHNTWISLRVSRHVRHPRCTLDRSITHDPRASASAATRAASAGGCPLYARDSSHGMTRCEHIAPHAPRALGPIAGDEALLDNGGDASMTLRPQPDRPLLCGEHVIGFLQVARRLPTGAPMRCGSGRTRGQRTPRRGTPRPAQQAVRTA